MTNNNLYLSLEDALTFADFYHNALRNAERRTVEEEFEKRNIPTIDLGKIDTMIEEERSNTVEVMLTKLKSRLFPKQ